MSQSQPATPVNNQVNNQVNDPVDELVESMRDMGAKPDAMKCQVCDRPARPRNISGFEDVLCEQCYRQRMAIENDHWNN